MSTIRNFIEARRAEKDDEGGFTLIELLIVIVVLGILAAIVVFAVQNLTGQSAKVACKADGKTIETAIEAQKAQVPGTTAAVPTTNGYVTDINKLVPLYVRSVPNSTRYVYSLGTAVGATTAVAGTGNAPTAFTAGTVIVSAVVPATATSYFDLNDVTATTGCNAVT